MVTVVRDGNQDKQPLLEVLASERLLAVVVLDHGEDAEPLAAALSASGLRFVEVTLRTDAALGAIARMAANETLVVGAGTVLAVAQVDPVIDAGARFVVSPGLNLDRVQR